MESKVRGDGFCYLRGATWWVGFYQNGKLIRESAKTSDRNEALKHLRKCTRNAAKAEAQNVPYLTSKDRKRRVSELIAALEKDYQLRGKLSPQARSNFKRISADFGAYRGLSLTREIIDDYITRRIEDGTAPASINRHTQLLTQCFEFAEIPAPRIRKLSEVGNERSGFFETEHLEAVLENLPDFLRDFAKCGFVIGWRKGALQTLRWSDVTDDVIYLRAKHSKSRKPESVPLVGELKEIIERRRAAAVWQSEDGPAHFSDYVFHHQGQPVGDFRKRWWTACCAAGVGKLVCPTCRADVDADHMCSQCGQTWKKDELRYTGAIFHDFRRTAARNLVRAGVPVPVAMKITGHRTDSMFRRYAIVDEDQKREALQKTEAYLAATTEHKVVMMRAEK